MQIRPLPHFVLILLLFLILLLLPSLVLAATHQVCDLSSPERGPFPNDRWTKPDASQNTHVRVNLPSPDCNIRRSDCEDIAVINALDGFSIQPRVTIPFDGPVDIRTVNSSSLYVVPAGSAPSPRPPAHVGLNRLEWDPATFTVVGEADTLLEQHTRYQIVVTTLVKDDHGVPVAPASRCANVFTTRSITATVENIRAQLDRTAVAPADFRLGPAQSRTVFALDDIRDVTASRHTGVNPARFTPAAVSLDALNLVPGSVGRIAFGKFAAPEYLVHPGEYIPPVGTASTGPAVQRVQDVYFNLFLPSAPQPVTGWPVVIFGHGANQTKESAGEGAVAVASVLASQGLATLAINQVGHGGGPLSTLTVTRRNGEAVTLLAGGRGIDQNGDGTIATREGDSATAPRAILLFADAVQQVSADLMTLVRVINLGMDIDGDGRSDIDPRRIYYLGNSQGGAIGPVITAVEPAIAAAVFINPAGPITENMRLSPLNRANVAARLAGRTPSLINAPGITAIGGLAVGQPFFNENKPLRDQPPVINTVSGAMDIQTVLDWMEWVPQSGSPVAYIPYVRKTPLRGMARKPVLYLFGKGDLGIPNLNTTQTLLAGDIADRGVFYRHDLAYRDNPVLPKDPHAFAVGFRAPGLLTLAPALAITLAAQQQIATFFASHGTNITQPQPVQYFEVPVRELPTGFNFIP